MNTLYIVNNNPKTLSLRLYSDGSIVNINPGEYTSVDCTSLIEEKYYLALLNQHCTVSYNPNVTKSSKASDSKISPVTKDPNSEILDTKLNEIMNTEDDSRIGVDTQVNESNERSLSDLEPWEYKKILTKLGINSRAKSASTLQSLVESNLTADMDWRELLNQD